MKRIGIWVIQLLSFIMGMALCGYDTIKITSKLTKASATMTGLDVWFGEESAFDRSKGIVIFSFAILGMIIFLALELIFAKETKIFAFITFALSVVLAILMFMGATSFMVNPSTATYDAFTSFYSIEITPICICGGLAYVISAIAAFAQAFTYKK